MIGIRRTKIHVAIAGMLISLCSYAQTRFDVIGNFHSAWPDSLTHQVIHSFDRLLISIENEQPDTTLIDTEEADLNRNFFRYLKSIEKKDTIPDYFRAQLINFYPVGKHECLLTLAYLKNNEIGCIQTFLAKEDNGKIVFASPLKYNTRHWKTKTIGTITYFFPDTIDIGRAELFDRKNITIARKLNQPVRHWDMYMCPDYQTVLRLQGCLYESASNGSINSGYIMDPKTFFSAMNDEDFSHDVLHKYASKIRGKMRNRSAECGLAYYWGNAYYSGATGKAPDLNELLPVLQQYLRSHKDARLLELFDKDPDVLAEYGYPKPIQVTRIISAVICREIERQKGTESIIELLKCGRGDENFFKSIDKLLGIRRDNFENEVRKFIFAP